jgi:Cu+-exporting ATPase
MSNQTATCPVCGMSVDITPDTPMSHFKDQTYYFCSESCKQAFDRAPEKYV